MYAPPFQQRWEYVPVRPKIPVYPLPRGTVPQTFLKQPIPPIIPVDYRGRIMIKRTLMRTQNSRELS